jgi:hypothetical protein
MLTLDSSPTNKNIYMKYLKLVAETHQGVMVKESEPAVSNLSFIGIFKADWWLIDWA